MQDQAKGLSGPSDAIQVTSRSNLIEEIVDGRSSASKSIGSLSQRLFESDDEPDENEEDRYLGASNGYSSQPGSKSNLLLCTECDRQSKTCALRPQTPSALGRYVEESFLDRHQEKRDIMLDLDYREDSNESPPCPQCDSNGRSTRCVNCELSETDEADLICFRCQADMEVCSGCERNDAGDKTTTSSSDESKYPIDAVVKVHVKNRSFEETESDENVDGEVAIACGGGGSGGGVLACDRLETIVEARGDTASENDEDAPKRLNGTSPARLLNFMIVLLL